MQNLSKMFDFALKQSNVSISLQERVMTKWLCIAVFHLFSIAIVAAVTMIAKECMARPFYKNSILIFLPSLG